MHNFHIKKKNNNNIFSLSCLQLLYYVSVPSSGVIQCYPVLSSVISQVSLTVVPAVTRAEANEILVDISHLSATWITPGGNTSDPNLLGDLSNWFSLVKEENGGNIAGVYYPRTEANATVAFKKSLSQLIAVVGEVSRTVEDGRVFVVNGRSQRVDGRNYVDVQKVSCCTSH